MFTATSNRPSKHSIASSNRVPSTAPASSQTIPTPAALNLTADQSGPQAEGSHRAARSVAPCWLVEPFRSISLEQLNVKADMLQRRDNKYVVRASVLQQAMSELARYFDILEIDGKRDFTYDTCYFDDAAHTGYFDHHQGRRIRCKVRMRKYVDAGLCFVEIKLKHIRGMTIKERLERPVDMHGSMDDEAREFIESCYRNLYGREFDRVRQLQPALHMRYQRVTLVAKQGGERMTVDVGVTFKGPSGSRTVDEDLFLVETKSRNANGIADKILRALHQHPTNTCSKYCVAMAALKEVNKYNKFLVALRKLGMLPATRGTRPWPLGPRQSALTAMPGCTSWATGQAAAAVG